MDPMNREPTPTRRPVPDTLFGGRLGDAFLLDLEVVDVQAIAPHIRSIGVASTDLVGFEHVPGQDLMIDFSRDGQTVHRRYTIRQADADAGTARLEFELHPGGGVAAEWAATARAGDRLQAVGPRGTVRIDVDARTHVFVADDSAVPAAFAMLESLPEGASATAVLVTPHGAGSRPGPRAGSASLTWTDEPFVADVLDPLEPGAAAYVFGERSLVRRAVQLLGGSAAEKNRIAAKAYWRRDQANMSHGEPMRD
jgi:NADPH-dependent ferric siderophore reductase